MHPYTFNIIKSTSSTHFSQQLNIQHNKTHIHLIPTLTNELKKAAPTKELLDLSNIKQQSHLPRFLPLLRPRGRHSALLVLLLRYRLRFSRRAASVKAPERRKNNASADFETRKKNKQEGDSYAGVYPGPWGIRQKSFYVQRCGKLRPARRTDSRADCSR